MYVYISLSLTRSWLAGAHICIFIIAIRTYMPHYSTGSALLSALLLLRFAAFMFFRYFPIFNRLFRWQASNVAHSSLYFLSSFLKCFFWVGRAECLLSIKINQDSVTRGIYTCSTFHVASPPPWLARACHFTRDLFTGSHFVLHTFLTHCTLGTLGLCFAALEIASTAPIATATATATAMHDARPTPRLRVRVRE